MNPPLKPGDVVVFPSHKSDNPDDPPVYWLFIGVIIGQNPFPIAHMFVFHTGNMPWMELHDVERWERL